MVSILGDFYNSDHISFTVNSFYGPKTKPHTRLVEAITDLPDNGKCNIVVVGPPTGGDGSDLEDVSDDELDPDWPGDVACVLRT